MTTLNLLTGPLAASVRAAVEAGWLVVPEPPRRCRRGHERSEENVYTSPAGREYCKRCRTSYMRGYEQGERRPYRPTHCPHGHPYDEKNTQWERAPNGRRRHCRTCKRRYDQARAA